MRHSSFGITALLGLAAFAYSTVWASAANVTGKVRDPSQSPPKDLLSGAKVHLHDQKGKKTKTFLSDADGTYVVKDVDDGEYTVVVEMNDYVRNPEDRTKITVMGDATAPDITLTRAYGDNQYYGQVADQVVKRVESIPEDQRGKAMLSEWNHLQAINLPPASKARFAVQLNERYARAREILPDLAPYLAATPEQIAEGQKLFNKALNGETDFPTRDRLLAAFNLGDAIVSDMVLSEVQNTKLPRQKRNAFAREFLARWEGTPASDHFLSSTRRLQDEKEFHFQPN
jgi:hypothetical protein